MITRPLDLASRLAPEPPNFDTLFYVNVGLLALFFFMFGSRFVLAPGVDLPQVAGSRAAAIPTTCQVSVLRSGQILTEDGLMDTARLPGWFKAQAGREKRPALLIKASAGVPVSEITTIFSLARGAGFGPVILATEEPRPAGGMPP